MMPSPALENARQNLDATFFFLATAHYFLGEGAA
jgi:hypothetical protein